MNIYLDHISKRFGREWIFKDVCLQFEGAKTYALTGSNGSGKSTLLQVIAGFMHPGKGTMKYQNELGKMYQEHEIASAISCCTPYMELIEELSLDEFFQYHFRFKKPIMPINDIVDQIGLGEHRNKFIVHFSSGMKQRVKLAQAIFADTEVLLLDEPCSNLDAAGIEQYHQFMQQWLGNRLLIVASNDADEYSMCSEHISMHQLKPVSHDSNK